MTQTIGCPSNHVCIPPVPHSQALPGILIVGVIVGILGRSIGRVLRFAAGTMQKTNPNLANASPIDDWALTIADLLDGRLPGTEPLNVEAVAKLIKADPTIVADLVSSPDVMFFRRDLNKVSNNARTQTAKS